MTNKPKSVVKRMEARELLIHPIAQRKILPSKVKRLKEDFDLDAIGVIHAIQRTVDGKVRTEVIDGQHRIIALNDLDLGEWLVDVKIHLDVTDDAGACRLFLHLNDRSPVSAYDKFENEVHAGIAEAVAIVSATRKHGLKINRSGADGTIICVNALKRVYCECGAAVLDSVLQIALAAWGKSSLAVDGKFISGLALVLSRYEDVIDTPVLIRKLAKYNGGPDCLIGAGLGLRALRKASVPRCIAEVIVAAYNSGRQTHKLDPV